MYIDKSDLQDAAGQLRRSPYQFSGIGGSSPQLFLALNYAVLDGPTLPIVAEGKEEPNDTYIEQLMAGAKAAVEVSVKGSAPFPIHSQTPGPSCCFEPLLFRKMPVQMSRAFQLQCLME